MAKIKIVLDADVIIHFIKGEKFSILPSIFKEYEHVIIDVVYNELDTKRRSHVDNQVKLLKNIRIITFEAKSNMLLEYAKLKSRFGAGESACMAYCKFNNDVIGSSNLKDIKNYCTINDITYITTFDFLYFAIKRNIITIDDAKLFIKTVKERASKLPDIDITSYISTAKI